MKIYAILIAAAVSFLIGTSSNTHASTCNPPRALANAEWASFGKVKTVISVEPFENQSKEKVETWLSTGLSGLAGDYLKGGKGVGVIKGLSRAHPPLGVSPTYIVSGAYQKTTENLRVFLKVRSASGGDEPLYNASFSVSPPESGMLFVEMGKAIRQVQKAMKVPINEKMFARETGATGDYRAFEAYIKGLLAMWKFDRNYLDVAFMWLQEAIKNDIYFQKPYIALNNTYGWLAMVAKAEGRPYSGYLEKLEAIENNRIRFENRPHAVTNGGPKVIKKSGAIPLTNRYLKGNAEYIAGVAAEGAGNLKEAAKNLEAAVMDVPEDTVALKALEGIYTRLGDGGRAAETLNKIATDGICY